MAQKLNVADLENALNECYAGFRNDNPDRTYNVIFGVVGSDPVVATSNLRTIMQGSSHWNNVRIHGGLFTSLRDFLVGIDKPPKSKLDGLKMLFNMYSALAELQEHSIFYQTFYSGLTGKPLPSKGLAGVVRRLGAFYHGYDGNPLFHNLTASTPVLTAPVHLTDVATMVSKRGGKEDSLNLDLVVALVSEKDGYYNMGVGCDGCSPFVKYAATHDHPRLVLIVNNNMPFIPHCGDKRVFENQIPIDSPNIDYVIEGDTTPLAILPHKRATKASVEIARIVAEEIILDPANEGMALQFGIGDVSTLAARALAESKSPRKFVVYSEIASDWAIPLIESGKVTGSYVHLNGSNVSFEGKITCCLVFGENKQFYAKVQEYADRFLLVPYVDLFGPGFSRTIAVNNALGLDFTPAVDAHCRDGYLFSGPGGQPKIARQTLDTGGLYVVCLNSTHGRNESSIVPSFPKGTIQTVPTQELMTGDNNGIAYAVTEWGKENLTRAEGGDGHRLSREEIIMRMIDLAHPSHRADLKRQAGYYQGVRYSPADKARYGNKLMEDIGRIRQFEK